MHGRLTVTSILHGDRLSSIATVVRIIHLDNFWFTIATHIGQYASFSFILYVLLNWFNRDKRASLLPEVRHTFLIVAALQHVQLFFTYQFHNSQKLYQGKNGVVWVLLKVILHVLLLQISCYERKLNLFPKITNYIVLTCRSWWIDYRSWLHIVCWERSLCTHMISCLLPEAEAEGNKNNITLVPGFNYTIMHTSCIRCL